MDGTSHIRRHTHTHIHTHTDTQTDTHIMGLFSRAMFDRAEKRAAERVAELRLHKGGKVPKTGNFRLKGGEVVLNKTQLAQLKKRKTAKGKQKVINDVSKRRPKKMKGGGRK